MRTANERHLSSVWLLGLTAGLGMVACSSSQNQGADTSSTGGSASASASSTASGGGAGQARTSGTTSSSGGSSASGGDVGSGGQAASGGVTGSGGASKTGGASSFGGTRNGGATTGTSASGGGTTSTSASGGTTSGTSSASGTTAATSVVGGSATGGQGSIGGKAGATGGTGAGGTGGASTGGSKGGSGACPSVDFGTWPTGKAPADIGKLAVNNFKSHTGDTYGYAWTFAYFGSLQFTQLTGDITNNDYLVSKFDCSQTGPDNSTSATVDDRAFGDLPFEIFLEKQTAACKTLGLSRADVQWANTTSDGITKDARYWIDDMFMITGLQVFAYRATKDSKYLDRAAKTMQAYFAALQQSDGLFWHTKSAKAYWGRANGWVASGMTELLLELPAGATRDAIMAGYKKQIDGLLPLQVTGGADAGCWRQVLDRTDASAESSCTAMFTYALVTGLKNGWLSGEKYLTAARNGWTALGAKTGSTGVLDKICPGTGAAPNGDLASQQQFYMKIALGSNDQHGQAPLLWSATALLRQDCRGLR
jgi:unsaturated rhamnogalacturonyl hydrolase